MNHLPLPPGPPGKLPVVGHALPLFKNPAQFLMDCYQRYGPVFHIYLGDKPTVFLIGPEGNRFLLSSGFRHFHWRPATKMLARYLGETLFVLDGEPHKMQRGLMQPAFHPSRFEQYVATMRRIFRDRTAQWERIGRIDLWDEMRRLTFEVAAQCLVGLEVGAQYDEYKRLFHTLIEPTRGELSSLPIPFFSPHARALKARARLWPMLQNWVEEKRRTPGDDVLSTLITARDENGQGLTDEQIIGQACGLIFAAHETTTNMAGFTLYTLFQSPEIRERVCAEVERVVGDGPVTAEHLPRLTYLFQVLKEVERYYPVVPFSLRGVMEEIEFGGYRIPAGWLAGYSPLITHRLPELFPEPDRFDPDRFASPREEHKKTPYGLVGFGGGPRICLGVNFATIEVAVLAVTVLRQSHLAITPGAIHPLVYLPTTHPKHPVWAGVHPAATAVKSQVI